MKKMIVLLSMIFLALIVVGLVSACISFPKIETKNNCTIEFISEYQNETAILAKLNNNKVACNFNTEDISILKDFVLNGYSVKEQIESEYETFLEEAKEENEGRLEDCLAYRAVYRNNTWTGYIATGYVGGNEGCAVMTCGSSPIINIIWNDLLPIAENDCKNLYWFDNDNKECGQKQFCGTYMYLGLQTFASKTQCLKALNEIKETCAKEGESCGGFVGILCCGNLVCEGVEHPDDLGTCVKENGTKKNCSEGAFSENNTCYKTLSNGRKAEIKIMPETASARAIERLGELGFTIELKEVGKETKDTSDDAVVYELTGKKQGKFLGIFKIIARVQARVDAETGEVKKVIKPWWSFLASGV